MALPARCKSALVSKHAGEAYAVQHNSVQFRLFLERQWDANVLPLLVGSVVERHDVWVHTEAYYTGTQQQQEQ